MKILVTGGSGKLGRYVVRELGEPAPGQAAHEVTVLDRSVTREPGGPRYLCGDVEDLGQVMEAAAGADAIIHLAAVPRQGDVPDVVTFRTNVNGAFNVHEAAWRLGVRRVVSTSSDAVLGWNYRLREFAPAYLPVDEDHPVSPQDAYGLSKQVGENVARSYASRSGLETIVLRPPWIVTPEASADLARSGGVEPLRFGLYSYVDVRDLARAYRLAVERPLPQHATLFVCADDSATRRPLCEILPELMPGIGELARALTGTSPGTSNRRAKQLLGWRPVRSWRHRDGIGQG